jgi:hypothetical protein
LENQIRKEMDAKEELILIVITGYLDHFCEDTRRRQDRDYYQDYNTRSKKTTQTYYYLQTVTPINTSIHY